MSKRWNFSTLKEHFDALRQADKEAVSTALAAAEKAVTAALTASEKAILKAEAAANDRFAAGNEIKGAMENAQKQFATMDAVAALRDRIDKLESAALTAGGKYTGMALLIGLIVGGIGIAGTLFTLFK